MTLDVKPGQLWKLYDRQRAASPEARSAEAPGARRDQGGG